MRPLPVLSKLGIDPRDSHVPRAQGSVAYNAEAERFGAETEVVVPSEIVAQTGVQRAV